MILVKILKRKDATSVIVAVIIAMIVGQCLSFATGSIAGTLSGLGEEQGFGFAGPEADWQQTYLYPAVWAAVQLVVLELLAWVIVLLGTLSNQPAKKKK